MTVHIIRADYHNPQHQQDLLYLLDQYARDPMGGGEGLKSSVKKTLIDQLQKRDFACTVLAYVDDQPAGIANCFEGFSTFAAKPLINIHDLAVVSEFRGMGISQALLQEVENIACEKGCCKVTLEVLSGNQTAINSYQKFGFRQYELDPEKGQAQFWEKKLA